MKRNRTAKVVVLAIMTAVSLTNLFGLKAAGISVILGIAAFLAFKIVEKQTFQECGSGFGTIGQALKSPGLWILIVLPSLMNVLVILLAGLILPRYLEHIASRSGEMLKVNDLPILMIQLLVFAIAEEIAWRAFFQRQVQSLIPVAPAILITSALFSLGHLSSGSPIIVAYDLLFVFVNSLFYGIVFKRTHCVWLSAAAHFAANLTAVIILFFL